MAEDNSNDRSQALMRVADAYPQPIIDITPGSDLDAGSPAPMGLMKNVTPGAAADAAAPLPAAAGDYVIELLEQSLLSLRNIDITVAEATGWLSKIWHQQEAIAAASDRARMEAEQDANEAGAGIRPVEAPEEDDSPWPVPKKGKLKEKAKGGLGAILKGLGGGLGFLMTGVMAVGSVLAGFALPVLGIIAALTIGYAVFKNVKWEDMIEPFENAFAVLKDVALSVWDIFGKVVDVIEVGLMPMLRFFGDVLNDFLIQPLITWLAPFWENTLSPLVDSLGEGLVTVKNFFKGIQDLRGADLRDAIVGGFMHMIDSLWDAMARSGLGKFFGMDTNEKKREQEFEKRREDAREQHKERMGVERGKWDPRSDTGIMALPENERAAAIAESEKWLEMDMRGIDSDVDAGKWFRENAGAGAAIAKGESMADSPGLVRQSMSVVESVVPKLLQSGTDAYAGLTIKGSSGGTQTGGGGQATEGGPVEPGVIDFASAIQPNVDGFTRFTAFNDNFHQASNTSLHAKGLALDFTVDDPSKAPAAAATVRRIAADAGVPSGGVDVIDEYNNPSSDATAGHIHAEFNSKEDAMKMAAGGLDSSPTLVPGAPAGRGGGDGAGGTGSLNAAAQLPGGPGASRSGAGVGTATSDLASQGAAAPVMVAMPGGQPLAPPAPPPVITIPLPMNARNEEQVHRALHSVNYV